MEAVVESKNRPSFTVVELGAGYGPWIVRAYKAFRKFSNAPVRLVAVEGDLNHYNWTLEHLRNNGISPAEYTAFHACASDKPTTLAFHQSDDPQGDYGQRIYAEFGHFSASERGGVVEKSGKKMQKIPGLSLEQITEGIDRVDLLHMDIQGAEYNVVKGAMKTMKEKVARVIIGAHSEDIEKNLRNLLTASGWINKYDFGRRSKVDTEWGPIEFRDGCQAWVNPRLLTA